MPAYTAVAMGIIAIGGSILQRRAENDNMRNDARQLGMSEAANMFAAETQVGQIFGKIVAAENERVQQNAAIEKAQAAAESDAKVSAAHAGVAGQSVDAVINDTERSAAEAKSFVDKRVRQERLQLSTDYVDNYLNAEMRKPNAKFNTKSSGHVAAEFALSFGQGFVSGGGLGE